MSDDKLQICRDFLENAYREKLDIKFSGSIAQIGKGRQPVWRFVSDDDLTSEVQPAASGAAGLLLDPEIGLLSYILSFHKKTNLHKQIVRALALRSQLSIERTYTGKLTDKSDSRGAWRVIVHWLIEADARPKWTDQIQEVRSKTAFSEELSLEAIFFTQSEFKARIEEYGFPRLLLTTREVFKKLRLEEMTNWLSANKLVEQSLAGFESKFSELRPAQTRE